MSASDAAVVVCIRAGSVSNIPRTMLEADGGCDSNLLSLCNACARVVCRMRLPSLSPTNSICCMLCALFSSGSACGMHIDSVGNHIYPSQLNPTTVISGHCTSAVRCGHTARGHESAVAGEITVLTSSTTFAGKPDISACFLIAS